MDTSFGNRYELNADDISTLSAKTTKYILMKQTEAPAAILTISVDIANFFLKSFINDTRAGNVDNGSSLPPSDLLPTVINYRHLQPSYIFCYFILTASASDCDSLANRE